MKYKIENLEDITDSREIMKSSPHGFSKYMTYIIIALVLVLIIWSLLAHKEISIKASGVVRPASNVNKISSSIAGSVNEINIKDGDIVSKGDTLIIVNGEQYELQKDVLEKSLNSKKKILDLNNKLKQSILDGENKFDSNNEEEKEYSKKYELFLANINSNNSQAILYDQQKDDINEEISNLELLKKAIEEGKNYFNKTNSFYYQYNDYILSMNSYEDKIKFYEKEIKEMENNNSNELSQKLKEYKNSLRQYIAEKDKLKNTTIMNIAQEIEQYKSKLSQVQVSLSNGTYKEQYISNLDSTISSIQSAIDEININLESVNAQIDLASIKATNDGIVNMLSEVNVGDFIQSGKELATIVPEDEENFQVDVYINNQDFGNIKEEQEVIIELAAFPSSEYGYIKSHLENLSVDAKNNQNVSYYTAICPIKDAYLKNKKDENTNIKSGMIAEVRIINRRVSYFKYFLEKIDILD